MAIIITGPTPCGICHEVLEEAQEIVGFSNIVANRRDPLHLFCDAAFHEACFNGHPLAGQVNEIDRRYRSNFENRVCAICAGKLTSPDDHFVTGYLAQTGELAEFNFLQMHQSCVPVWSGRERFESALGTAVTNGFFENEYTVRYFKEALEWHDK